MERNDAVVDGDEATQLTQTQVEVTQTQVEVTQLEATQVAVTQAASAAVDDVVRCMICSLNLTAKSILERELHLNACLDATNLADAYDCPTCGKQLTEYNEQRRMAHVNLCLDRVARFADKAPPTDPPPTAAPAVPSTNADDNASYYGCRICHQRLLLTGLEARSRHVKQCGQRFGLRPSDLATTATDEAPLVQDPEEPPVDVPANDQATDRPNAFTVLMASAAPRPSTAAPPRASNAFDILMKSSRTEAVAASTSARSFWHTTATTNNQSNKRPRFTPSSSSSSSSSRPPQARRYGCPDFKRILSTQPPFIVDGFRYASKALSNVYFLTHFHSDHYTGLQKTFDCGIIYCNDVTAALTIQELGVDAKFVHPVPMNTPVEIRGVQVTFMDANHCPGAAIILFRLRSGVTYLHTGDFRFHPKMLTYAPLQPFLPSATGPPTRRLDAVYLDTTYADPKYTFPTQEASIAHALTLVDKHMGDKVLFLFGSYSIGKERLFMEVARRYQRKVCVSKAKLKLIKTYAWPDAEMKLLTIEPAVSNLHVVPMQELKLEHLVALQQKHRLRFHHIVAFRPTGWTFSGRSSGSMASCQSDASGAVRIYGLPYSEHSSFAELCDFVRALNPQTIIPTVNCHTERSVKKQVDALRQSAFHSIGTMFAPAK